MIAFFNKLRDSLNSVSGSSSSLAPRSSRPSRPSRPGRLAQADAQDAVTEQFRRLLLDLVRGVSSDRAARLGRRLRAAQDLQALWFMRSEVMALLSPLHGEAEAMHRLEIVSATVRESLPSGLRSRPSPLAGL